MDGHFLRILITGTIGGLLSLWVMDRWARYVPTSRNKKTLEQLLVEYRLNIFIAKFVFFGVILFGIYLFQSGRLSRTSWTHFGIMMGVAMLGAVAGLLVPTLRKGRGSAAEAITAFAMAEKVPIPFLAVVVLLGVVGFSSALGYLIFD